MIKFSLTCHKEHAFDGWFASSEAYDKQRKRGLVVCPACGSKKVDKALMAPNVGVRQNKKSDRAAPVPAAPTPVEAPAGPPTQIAAQLGAKQRELLDLMRKVRAEVEKSAEYVGPRFAEEARKIHHEESPTRGIYGEATIEEAKALAEEGIEAYPLPRLPEDGH